MTTYVEQIALRLKHKSSFSSEQEGFDHGSTDLALSIIAFGIPELERISSPHVGNQARGPFHNAERGAALLAGPNYDKDHLIFSYLLKSTWLIIVFTVLKGFNADNKNIDLLRLRNYTIGRKLTDEDVLGADGISRIADLAGVLTPFVSQ